MANALYNKARERFLKGDIDWLNDTIKAVLVDAADYTVALAVDEFLDDIPAAARVATAALAGKTATDGVADASDTVLSSVSGDESEAVILYKDTGAESTSPLIAYIDTASGLPVTPNGQNITLIWDNGPNKVFRL